MFATLLGGLPRPDPELDRAIELAVRAQEEAGLEPITDGRLRDPDFDRLAAALAESDWAGRAIASVVEAWRAVAASTDRAAKQALPGPYSVGRRPASESTDRLERTLGVAGSLAATVEALAAAGCPLVEIEETEAHHIGADEDERRLFLQAHQRLVDQVRRNGSEIHLSLSIVGGSAADAGVKTILAAPYSSFAFDLIAGPDNWNLAVRTPGDRGVIAGVQAAREVDESKEVMLWAAHYAASTGGRGLDRVGLGSAGSFANLTWEAAARKMRLLGATARLASMAPSEELARSLDPAAVSSRRAALGHGAPKPPRRPGTPR